MVEATRIQIYINNPANSRIPLIEYRHLQNQANTIDQQDMIHTITDQKQRRFRLDTFMVILILQDSSKIHNLLSKLLVLKDLSLGSNFQLCIQDTRLNWLSLNKYQVRT